MCLGATVRTWQRRGSGCHDFHLSGLLLGAPLHVGSKGWLPSDFSVSASESLSFHACKMGVGNLAQKVFLVPGATGFVPRGLR